MARQDSRSTDRHRVAPPPVAVLGVEHCGAPLRVSTFACAVAHFSAVQWPRATLIWLTLCERPLGCPQHLVTGFRCSSVGQVAAAAAWDRLPSRPVGQPPLRRLGALLAPLLAIPGVPVPACSRINLSPAAAAGDRFVLQQHGTGSHPSRGRWRTGAYARIFSCQPARRSSAAFSTSSLLAKWKRTKRFSGALKKQLAGTVPTPTLRMRSTAQS
jgi:hypothetical protein